MEPMEFMRGDRADHTFAILADAWSAGGRLYFAAKVAIDDDSTDSSALIAHSWGDEAVTDVVINNVAYKKYACYFPGSATNEILSEGAESLELLGEFQWVPGSGADPITFPAPGQDRIPTTVYFDIKRKTVV